MAYRTPSPCQENRRLPMLASLSTKTPCSVRWSEMDGDARARFCFRCSKNVYDLSAMTEDEAESFLAVHSDDEEQESKSRKRFFRRPDGTILTENCTVGRQRKHTRVVLFSASVFAALTAILAFAFIDVRAPAKARFLEPSNARIEPPRQKVPSDADWQRAKSEAATEAKPNDDDAQFHGYAIRPWQTDDYDNQFPPGTIPWAQVGRSSRGAGRSPLIRNTSLEVDDKALPREVVQRIVRQNFGRFRLCYEAYLRSDPTKAGELRFAFVIGRDGAVNQAMIVDAGQAWVTDSAFPGCVARSFQNLSFPQPENGIVKVTYGLYFAPEA